MPPTLTLEKLLGSTIPCFLCGEELAIRTDKNSKRYFICNACGLQAFVRKQDGIKKLEKLASEIGILFPDPDLVRIKEALEHRLEFSLQRLEALVNQGKPEATETPNP